MDRITGSRQTVFGLDYSGGALLVAAPSFPLGALYLSLVFHVLDYTYGGVDDGLLRRALRESRSRLEQELPPGLQPAASGWESLRRNDSEQELIDESG